MPLDSASALDSKPMAVVILNIPVEFILELDTSETSENDGNCIEKIFQSYARPLGDAAVGTFARATN
jgi:hypothetical protein